MAELEKVIKGLKEFKADLKPYAGNSADWEKVDNALSLLKAQEPKPPRFAVAFDKIFYACDKCGKSLLVVLNAEGVKGLGNMPKYCPECGQAVKWDG